MDKKIYPNFIAGAWVAGDAAIVNNNPSDLDETVGRYAIARQDQVADAVAAAKKAQPAWARTTPQVKADALDQIGMEIIARKDELGALLSREEGKPLAEGIGETMRAGQLFKWFAGEALRLHGDRMPSLRPNLEVEVTREPIGVIAVITPWNFPMGVAAWKVAPALACGNTVILKPSETVPGSAWALSEIIARSGLPDGVFNLVMGDGATGQALTTHKDVNGITFTGSTNTGRAIATAAAPRFCRLQLEMGGKNPLVVLDDADLDLAVECAFQGAFLATGQRCTASSRLIVQENIHDRFVAGLAERLARTRIDHALKAGTEIGPVVSEEQLAQDLRYIDIGLREGAHLVFGGEPLERQTRGHYLNGAIFTDADNRMRISREEIFGPIAAVIRVKDYEEALAIANDTEYGLTASIMTRSLKHASHFKRNVETGLASVNLPTVGADYNVPFGGRKNSSYGPRETGEAAREFFTTTKTAYTRSA